jgi:VWFA-related protein
MKTRTLQPRLPLLFAAALSALAGTLPAGPQGFSETTQVVAVEVPVQVVRDGEPVRGLTAADFEVYDGRKKQTITGFEVLDLGAAAGAARPAPPVSIAARRHFLLFFDLSYSEPRSIAKAREAVQGLVLKNLHPSDLVAVATYSQARGPQLALGFTSDRHQVEKALATLGLPELVDRSPDPLRLVAAEAKAELSAGHGGKNADAIVENLESLARESKRADLTTQRNNVTALTRSFADLAKMMNSVQGRKYVVYLSEGFDSSILTGTTDQKESQEMNEASAEGAVFNVNSEQRYGDTTAANNVERMLEEFRRADCAIQAVDIGGLRAAGDLAPKRGSGQDTLFQMAKDTGGEMYQNFNDLGTAMEQMLKKTSVTYVLAFQAEGLKMDGTYHRLRVELKNAPRGTRVVSRPGYYAPRPYTARNPLEKLLDAANQVIGGGDRGPLAAAVLAAPFNVGGPKAYVPVLIEVDGNGLLAGSSGKALPAEIYAYAMDSSGAVHDYFTQTLGLDLAKVEPVLRQSGLKFFGHLDLPPGDYTVRVLVRNGTTGSYGVRVVPLTVPAFTQGKPVLLAPFFPEALGKWLMVREAPRGEAKQVPYPFMAKQEPYIPASRPVLGPGQEAKLSLVGWNLEAGDLKPAVKVLAADGKELPAGELRVVEREKGGAGEPDRLVATYRPPKLQPGEYRLVVTLSGAGGATESGTAAFVVKL